MTALTKPIATLLVLSALLAACSRDATPPAPAEPPYAAVARGRVDVEGGLLNITSPVEGRLNRIPVHEGQHVRRGELLVEIDDARARLDIKAAQAALAEAQAQLHSVEGQADAMAARADRLHKAAAAGVAEGQAADDAQAQSRQLAAQKDIAAAARAAAEARLATARHVAALHRITAPQDGEVTQVLAQVGGQAASPAGPLLVLLPQVSRIVRAELGDARADTVKPGMTALVSPEDDPDHTVNAKVLRISPVSGPPRLEDDPQRRGVEHAVECVLALEGNTPLRVGQRVMVRIGGKAP